MYLCHVHFLIPPKITYIANKNISGLNMQPSTLVPEVFFRREENIKRQTKKQQEKTSGYPRCESHYHAMIGVNQHHEID